jgi:hypothetical protein
MNAFNSEIRDYAFFLAQKWMYQISSSMPCKNFALQFLSRHFRGSNYNLLAS